MMVLTGRVLNNENIQDEAFTFTAIIKMFGSRLQVGIVQSVHCLWANFGEKPLNSIASCVSSQATQNFHAKN